MDILWSPWRSKYIEKFKDEDSEKGESCIFCDAINNTGIDGDSLIVARRKLTFVIMNKFPYNNGHLLIAPYKHVGEMYELSDDELSELMFTVRDSLKVLDEIFKPHGYNVGANLGRTAGAGVPGHLHFHIVPRWNGDTSFMAVCSDVKVVSQSLEDSQKKISESFKKLFP
jgi:ATP adenylyltransferase